MKARPVIVIILTLAIGFILGMLTSAQLRLHKLKPVRVFYSEERFREGFYKTIEPDEKQKAAIDLILEKYAKINGELQSKFRKDLEINMKDFRREIDSNLTKDQIARLKAMDEKRQQMIRQGKMKMGKDSLHPHNFGRQFSGERPPFMGPPPFGEQDSLKSGQAK